MNVVFDFGGVLFDWQPERLLREVIPQHAPTADAAARLVVDFFQGYGGDWAAFDRGTTSERPLAELISRRLGLPFDDALAVIAAIPDALTPRPAMVRLLERLDDAGWPLYYLSNMPSSYAEYLERNHAFLTRFRGGVFSSRTGLIKPEPEIYELASRRLALDPASTVFIDDVEVNVQAARRHGWRAFHFTDPQQCERDLAALDLLAVD